MLEVRENFGITQPFLGGTVNPRVRADMVYFTTPGGGGVFSTGSIAWSASLSHDDYDNNVSRITANVFERFASPDPLP
jgi:N,N-dimethylformamidase